MLNIGEIYNLKDTQLNFPYSKTKLARIRIKEYITDRNMFIVDCLSIAGKVTNSEDTIKTSITEDFINTYYDKEVTEI